MVKLVILGGTGDVYLVCALVQAFKERHGRDATVVLRHRYACIADMFGVAYEVNDEVVSAAELDPAYQRDYDNQLIDDRLFYTHPCFLRSGVRVDHLTTKPDASQADMYKMILRIPADVPLALPMLPNLLPRPNIITIIPQATSWPNEQPDFWVKLANGLRSSSWSVEINDLSWPLKELLERCATSEWVIGPQCGVMSILVTGRFLCRKTLAVSNVDDNAAPGFLSRQTYPYAYVTKFSNQDYDVEEFKISNDSHQSVVAAIVNGVNAQRLWPHNPNPVMSVNVPLTPGDFLDRLAVLTVKYHHLSPPHRAGITREYLRHIELRRLQGFSAEVDALYLQLVDMHNENYKLLERVVPAAFTGAETLIEDHCTAIRSNKLRVGLKQRIDALCHAPYQEVKSYYPPTQE